MMTKKNLSDLLRQETEKILPDSELPNLEQQVQSLESQLNQAQDHNLALEKQIQALEQELREQQELVKKLYTNLQTPQTKSLSTKVPEKKVSKAPLSKVRAHSIQPRKETSDLSRTSNNLGLSNQDIGWFD
jgi:chromosome segregation ATPase